MMNSVSASRALRKTLPKVCTTRKSSAIVGNPAHERMWMMFGVYPNKGHLWQVDEFGDVDTFAFNHEPHNGPKCMTCGYHFCHHCKSEPEKECSNPVEWPRILASK